MCLGGMGVVGLFKTFGLRGRSAASETGKDRGRKEKGQGGYWVTSTGGEGRGVQSSPERRTTMED